MALSGLELHPALQVDVSGKENPLINVVVEGVHGNAQLRVVRNDHVGGLPLLNEWFHDPVDGMQLFFGQADAGAGVGKAFGILSVRRLCIVIVFSGDLAFAAGDRTAVTDKGCFVYMAAFFAFKPVTYVVADMAGTAVSVTQDELVAGIRFFTVEPVDTEVIGIGKAAPVPCVCSPVLPDFIRDGGGILAEISGYLAEGFPFI